MALYPDLKNKVALVTGGANGIGAAIVKALAMQGSKVHFCDVDARGGQALARQIGSQASFHKVDLAREDQITRWVGGAGRKSRRLDILINNAAFDPRIALNKMSAADWDQLFALNLRAYFLASREFLKFAPEPGAAIVNLSSITVHIAPAEMSAYVATKAGILGFTRSLARELGPHLIRVNAVSPGWTMTERQLRQYVNESIKALILRSQCLPKLIEPAEIAEVVLFAASEASSAMTGQELLADRGWAHS